MVWLSLDCADSVPLGDRARLVFTVVHIVIAITGLSDEFLNCGLSAQRDENDLRRENRFRHRLRTTPVSIPPRCWIARKLF